jgi:aldose 1-epimerase
MEVTVVPEFGNRAIEFSMHGKNLLFFPYEHMADFRSHPGLDGVPFLAPWANRLDGESYWVNGKEYTLNPKLNNFAKDAHGLPIHGLLQASALWEVSDMGSDSDGAWVTSRLALWKYPELMEQWPFAEEYEMTYRLSNGMLEVRTTIVNKSAEAVPVAIGFHPYYRIPDQPRDEWTLDNPAQKSVVANQKLIPTGEFVASKLPAHASLKGRNLDDGFADLQRDSEGRARFVIAAGQEQIELLFGPKFPIAVIWEPPARDRNDEFICIEPMTGPTNAINLAHEGKYPELQTVPSGGTWVESFWIHPSGF